MKQAIFLFTIVFFTFENLFAQQTIFLYPNRDSGIGYHTNRNSENTNYGNAPQICAIQIPSFDSTGVNTGRTLFDFDWSQIPAFATITSAKLNFYAYDYDGTHPSSILNNGHVGNNSSYLRRVTQNWGEYTVTWNTQPTATNTNQVILPASTSSNQDYLNIDVTQLVQDILANPTTSHGFLLGLVDEVLIANLSFHSMDGNDPTKHPKLEITYEICGQIEMYPNRDAGIGYHDNRNSENTNYGNAPQTCAMQIPSFDSTGVNTGRTLFDFDWSQIPASSTITSAKLNFYAYDYDGTHPSSILNNGHVGNNSSYLRRVTQNWGEYTVTWNTQPSATNTNQVILPASTSSNQDYLDIDVTQLVQDIIDNPTTSHGFLLGLVDEVLIANLSFHSTNGNDPTKHPRLVLDIECKTTSAFDNNKTTASNYKSIVYPNPSANFISIKTENLIIKNLKIYSFDGKLVLTQNEFLTHEKIDVSNFENGMYFMIFENDSSRESLKFTVNK
jgi:hypothetical protein